MRAEGIQNPSYHYDDLFNQWTDDDGGCTSRTFVDWIIKHVAMSALREMHEARGHLSSLAAAVNYGGIPDRHDVREMIDGSEST